MGKRPTRTDTLSVEATLDRAREALEAYDYPLARELLDAAFERSEGSAPIARALTELLVDHLGCDAEARVLWPRLSKEARADHRVLRSLAEASARSGDLRRAEELIAPVRTADAATVWAELGRRWLVAGELDAVPGCIEEIRELAPASAAVVELERRLEDAHAELRAPEERALEELAAGGAPVPEVERAATELLRRWPGSESAARVLREAERRAREEAQAAALSRARLAEQRGDLPAAHAALADAARAGADTARDAERLRARMAEVRHAASVAAAREAFGRSRSAGLAHYAQSHSSTRHEVRPHFGGPDLALLDEVPAAHGPEGAEALVLEVRRALGAERALTEGRAPEAQRDLERLVELRSAPTVLALREKVTAALEAEARGRRDAAMRRARELLDGGDPAAARELLRDVPRGEAAALLDEVHLTEAHRRRVDAVAAAVARRDWLTARESARGLAALATDEAERDRWTRRAHDHDEALRRAHCLHALETPPAEPPPEWHHPPECIATWRTPDGEHIVCPTHADGWVFLRWLRTADGGCERAVRLRFRQSRFLEVLSVRPESLLLLGETGEALELSADGTRILHVTPPPSSGRIETVDIGARGTHIWIAQTHGPTLVVDRLSGAVVRRLEGASELRPVDGPEGRFLVEGRYASGSSGRGPTTSLDVRASSGRRVAPGRVPVPDDESLSEAVDRPDGGLLVLTRSDETLTLRRYDPQGSPTGALALEGAWPDGHHALMWSPRGARLLYVGDDGLWRVSAVDADDGALSLEEPVRVPEFTALVRDPAGRWPTLATFSFGEIRIGDELGAPFELPPCYSLPYLSPELEPVLVATEQAARLRRLPASARLEAVKSELGDRPSEDAVVAAAVALRATQSYEHARTLLQEHLAEDPSRERIAVELARLLPGLAPARMRGLLEPYADRVRPSADGALLGWLLGTARLDDGDVEGGLAALKAGVEAGTRGAKPLEELLRDIEALYGEDEPADPRLRRAHRGLRALARADARIADEDDEGAARELQGLLPDRGLGGGALVRAADIWLRREASDERGAFSKIEVLGHLVSHASWRVGGWLPSPGDPYPAERRASICRRAREHLDALDADPIEPAWASELDAALDEAEPEPPRLVWRLEGPDEWTVRPYVRRPTERGGHTPGRRADPAELMGWTWISPLDASIARVVLAEVAHPADRLAIALELLADQSHLELGGQVVQARWHAPVLTVGAAGLELVLGHGETRTAAATLSELAGARHLLRIDAASAEVDVWRFDEAQLRILAALATHTELPRAVLARRLARLAQRFALELPDELCGPAVAADERLHLRAEWRSDELRVRAFLRPAPGGPERAPGQGRELTVGVLDGVIVHVRRDLDLEADRAREQMTELGLDPDAQRMRWVLAGPEAALELVSRAGRASDRYVLEWDGEPLVLAQRVGPGALRVKVDAGAERWLSIDGALEVDGRLVQLGHLIAELSRGQRYVRIEGRRFVYIEERLREWARTLGVLGDARADGTVRLGTALASWLRGGAVAAEGDARWSELAGRSSAAEAVELPALGPLDEVLWPFQREGVRWLYRLTASGMGGCLADDMGLGKTLQALGLLAARAGRGPALVVAPTSVLHPWDEHARALAPSLSVHLHHGARRDLPPALGPGDLVVTTYGVLVQDRELLAARSFATLILDEAQIIKNPRSRRYGAVRALDAEVAVALTGTPIENHLGDLWSLFSVLEPTLFGGWARFRSRFARPVERRGDREAPARLAQVLRPFLLRRTKAEVLPELPPRTTSTIEIEQSPAERAVYEAARAEALEAAEGADRVELLSALTRLRQLACDVRLVDASADAPSTKLRTLCAIVAELRAAGHRALVFSQFVRLLERARAQLEGSGVCCAELTGATPAAERSALGESLRAGEIDVLLVSLKAGGTGLTLTGASYVIHLDPWWNPAVEDQASDRAHRIGQTEPVTVLRLVSAGTIEEAVLALHREKRDLVDAVLDGSSGTSALTRDELLALVRSPVR